jgi:hypothetical protein
MFPAAPNRTDCVNDKPSRQTIAAYNFSFAWATTAERAALGEQVRARGAVNCAIHAATTEERCVSSVHDRVHV